MRSPVWLGTISEDTIRTRGNKYKLIQHHCYYDLRKFNFTDRVIPVWNSLPNHGVSADTINTFNKKALLSQRWPRDAPYKYGYMPWKFSRVRESLSRPTVTFPEIFNGLLFRAILWMCVQNLKFLALGLPVPEIIGGIQKLGSPWIRHAPLSPNFFMAFCSDWACECCTA